jgi:hypothetical protein
MKEFYSIEFDNRQFDNVIDAVQAATALSSERDGSKVKVYRSVLYTHATEPQRYTLTVVEMPSKATLGQRAGLPQSSIDPLVNCFNCRPK